MIKFRDIKKGKPVSEMTAGVMVEVALSTFYNGLEVQKFPLQTIAYNPNMFEVDLDVLLPFSGFTNALAGLTLGSQRQIIVPPSLGYGPAGYPPFVPSNATVVLDIALRPPSIEL